LEDSQEGIVHFDHTLKPANDLVAFGLEGLQHCALLKLDEVLEVLLDVEDVLIALYCLNEATQLDLAVRQQQVGVVEVVDALVLHEVQPNEDLPHREHNAVHSVPVHPLNPE
jgi:hypothetical protein